MISPANLKGYSLKDLAQLARNRGVRGWHTMRKDQLLRALAKANPAPKLKNNNGLATKKPAVKKAEPMAAKSLKPRLPSAPASHANGNGNGNGNGRTKVLENIHRMVEERGKLKDLSAFVPEAPEKPLTKDRVVLMVRDPYWLHIYFEVRKQTVQRAQAALAEHWHTAHPVLRLMETVDDGTTNTTEKLVREVEIHGGVRNWYLDVNDPPRSYRVEIGYKAANGAFFPVCRSNSVTTPRPGMAGPKDGNWSDVAENCERIYAMSGGYANENGHTELQELFEERMRRPMGSPSSSRFGDGATRMLNRERHFKFDVEAEILVTGSTKPGAYVTLSGEPVKVNADGTFNMRLHFPDRRQVIPLVAASADGVEQRTVVIAVERNTKVMEPVVREQND